MKKISLLIIGWFVCSISQAQEVSPLVSVTEHWEQRRHQVITDTEKELQEQLKNLDNIKKAPIIWPGQPKLTYKQRKQLTHAGMSFHSFDHQNQTLQDARRQLKDIYIQHIIYREGAHPTMTLLDPRLIANDIGELNAPIEIEQIIGPLDMLAKADLLGPDGSWARERRFWLKGFSTTGLDDDATINIEHVVRVTGNKTYSTASGGSRTVMVVEKIDIDTSSYHPTPLPEFVERIWRDDNGKALASAIFLEAKKDSVTLRIPKGEDVSFPLKTFSVLDLDYLVYATGHILIRDIIATSFPNEWKGLEPRLKKLDAFAWNKNPEVVMTVVKPDTRVYWYNQTYQTVVQYDEKNKIWREIKENKNGVGKVLWDNQETSRTADYIELHSPERNTDIRLRADKMEQKIDGQWKQVAQGAWFANWKDMEKAKASR